MNVTVRNVITSMRLISWFDWAEFVEGLSLVDECLRRGQRVRRHGLRHARSVSACHREAGAAFGSDRGRGTRGSALAAPPGGSGTPRGSGRSAGRRRTRSPRPAPPTTASASRQRAHPDPRAMRPRSERHCDRTDRGHDPGYYLISGRATRARAGAGVPRARGSSACGAPSGAGPPWATWHPRVGHGVVLAPPLWLSARRHVPVRRLLRPGARGPGPGVRTSPSPCVNWLVTHLVGPRPLPRLELAGGVPSSSGRSSWSRRCLPTRRTSRRRWASWRSTSWRTPTVTCASLCSPIGWTLRASRSQAMMLCWPRRRPPSTA